MLQNVFLKLLGLLASRFKQSGMYRILFLKTSDKYPRIELCGPSRSKTMALANWFKPLELSVGSNSP